MGTYLNEQTVVSHNYYYREDTLIPLAEELGIAKPNSVERYQTEKKKISHTKVLSRSIVVIICFSDGSQAQDQNVNAETSSNAKIG